MKPTKSPLTIEEIRASAKADFLRKLRANRGYKRLAEIRRFDERSLSRLEDSCWLLRRAAARSEIRGARAKAALRSFNRFLSFIAGGFWLSDGLIESLDALRRDLERLASKSRRGAVLQIPLRDRFEAVCVKAGVKLRQ